MNLKLFDKIIRNIDDIILKLKSLEYYIDIKLYFTNSFPIDSSLNSYHAVAKEIKRESIANAKEGSGKIMANI
jgi:hypothetical protein